MSEEPEREHLEEMLAALHDPALLKEFGYRLTPKGVMALLFMDQYGYDLKAAETFAQKIEDTIFKAGYVYFHEDQVTLRDKRNNGEV